MANTRELIGDEATINGLLEDTLETFEDEDVTVVGRYALAYRKSLTTVILPSCTDFREYSFYDCENLRMVRVGPIGSKSFRFYSTSTPFWGCGKLQHIIIDSNVLSQGTVNSLKGTPIIAGNGAVYVPESKVDSYRADSVWGCHVILPMSAYPASKFETVTDTWAEIAASSADGTYDEKYKVGDIKSVVIAADPGEPSDEGGTYKFVLCAKNTDVLASDRSKTANMTWVMFKTPYRVLHQVGMYDESSGSFVASRSWEKSNLRSELASDVLPLLESDVANNIKPVVKYTYGFDDDGNGSEMETIDSLWIPSRNEVWGTYNKESRSTHYAWFIDKNRRCLYDYLGANSVGWMLRSSFSTTKAETVSSSGSNSDMNYVGTTYPVLGFCI
ncbi:MAG: hypothetical protein IKF14_18385 [Atopobiaceae bacterium]|nr:hypothetical protein [Atopobiaceae bacterium]MBR3161058.1 hypothetical protein [Atopobiaceae bacterium]